MADDLIKKIVPIISFETGGMSRDEIEAILGALPVDISFFDKEDILTYFNRPGSNKRIFARTSALIGKRMQQLFPESIDKVNQILNDFRSGKKDVVESWIPKGNRTVHVRYFAARNGREYLGCLEVSQDITDIEKRTRGSDNESMA